ncbi:hypothetical protein F5Y17DRAFT_376042 [Xylariaceae sp. FL0594]|nr:hypothetical protein F5Y17DRAFT_376042 [Xylariaceae sp. FL0594]
MPFMESLSRYVARFLFLSLLHDMGVVFSIIAKSTSLQTRRALWGKEIPMLTNINQTKTIEMSDTAGIHGG